MNPKFVRHTLNFGDLETTCAHTVDGEQNPHNYNQTSRGDIIFDPTGVLSLLFEAAGDLNTPLQETVKDE